MSANKVRFTDRTLKALKPVAKPCVLWDESKRSFGVRIFDKTQKHVDFGDAKDHPLLSFVVVARQKGTGKLRWVTLGKYPDISLEEAHDKADKALRALRIGQNPIDVEREELRAKERGEEEQRIAEEKRQKHALAQVIADYLKRHVSTLRSARPVESLLRRELLGEKFDGQRWVIDRARKAPLRNRPISEISRAEIVEAVSALVDRGYPYQAHLLLANTRAMFAWAVDFGTYGIDENPAAGIKSAKIVGKLKARSHTLDDHELRLVWQAAAQRGYPFGTLIQALTLSGQRLREIANLAGDEIDLERQLITIPEERMKSKAAHVVPISPRLLDLLTHVPRFKDAKNKFVFSTTYGKRPISGFGKSKIALDGTINQLIEAAKLRGEEIKPMRPWRLHDLRRTVRTRLSELKVPHLHAELVLAHKLSGIHAVYDLHSYNDEKRAALLAWERTLLAIVEPPPPTTKVADLAQARAKRAARGGR